MSAFGVLFFRSFSLTFSFIFVQQLFSNNQRINITKKEASNRNSNKIGWVPYETYGIWFTMRVFAFVLFRSFSSNLHFHCCSALISFIFIIIVLRCFSPVYLQNFIQHYNTTSATTKKRVGTAVVILFNLLYYNIS